MIFLLSLVAIFLVIFFYRRTTPAIDPKKKLLLGILRSLCLIIVLMLLLNPILYLLRTDQNKPQIIMFNDTSESMTIAINDTTKSERLEIFRNSLEQLYEGSNYQLLNYNFATGLKGDKDNTLLVRSLDELFKANRNADIVEIFLLSDGWIHDEQLDFLNDLDTPISTFNPQFISREMDLEIRDLTYNKIFYTDEINSFVLELAAENFTGKANLQFYIENNLIKTQEIDFTENQFQQMVLEHSFTVPGLYPVEFKLVAEEIDENNTANNVYPAAVNVQKQRSGILVISDKLGWDIKFLKDAINKNERWDYSYLQKEFGLKEKDRQVALSEKLLDIDVLILINYAKLSFSEQEKELIKNHITRGGGLLLQGKVISSLEEIIPAGSAGINREFSSTLFFTEESSKYASFDFTDSETTEEIPPVRYYYCNPKLQSEVLAGFNNEDRSAAIVYSQLEKGRILYFAFYDLWKWQLRDTEQTFQSFITDICNWLSVGNTERFISFSDKNSYFTGETVKIDLQAYDEKLLPRQGINAKLVLSDDSGKTILEKYLDSGEDGYFTFINDLQAGKYTYKISDEEHQQQTSGQFIITEANAEQRDTGFNLPLLSYISETTGGELHDLTGLEKRQIPSGEIRSIARKIEIPIYKSWYLITVFIILFCLEIYLRKRWGLL